MRNKYLLSGVATLAQMWVVAPAYAQAQAQAQAPVATAAAADNLPAIEDIVVTAQKREERLQDVPISITAVSQQTLEANRIYDLSDLTSLAPNVVVKVGSPGLQALQTDIRGVLAAALIPGAQRGVSYYLDGVYLGANSGSTFEVADLQRIEVLKGPQGTLFGRNATGGAISLVTTNPAGQLRVKEDLSYGNFNQFRSKTRIDSPQWGPLSASVTYVHSQRDGDTRNLGAGTVWDFSQVGGKSYTAAKRLGDQDVNGVGVTLRLEPLDGLDIVYKFDYSHNNFTPVAAATLDSNLPGRSLAGIIAAQTPAVQATLSPYGTKRPDAVNNWFSSLMTEKNLGHTVTASYKLTDHISFKNVFGYRRTSNAGLVENDGLGGLYLPSPLVPAGTPFMLFGTQVDFHESQWSNETQVNIDTKPVYFTGGFITYHEKTSQGADGGVQVVSTAGNPALGCPGLVTRSSTNPLTFVIPASFSCQPAALTRSRSQAVFGQAEVHVTEQIDLVGGLRQTWDKNRIFEVPTGAFPPRTDKGHKLTYLGGVNYKPARDLLFYAKYGTGYITGGTYHGFDYAPETSKSAEAGVKADWFDNKLRTNLALFHVIYGNLQSPVAVPVVHIENSGKARAQGFEFEATVVPLQGLSFSGGIGYTDFKYLVLAPQNQAIVNAGGIFVPLARPKWTGSISAQYQTEPMSWGGRFLIRADGNFESSSHLFETAVNAAQLDQLTPPSSMIVNGRVAITDIRVGSGKATAALWVKNLFDNDNLLTTVNLDPNTLVGTIFQPKRTFGVDVSFTF